MNKTELINAIATEAKVSKVEARATFEAAVKAVSEALVKGDKVSIIGFGTFAVKESPARTGRNPRTNETIEIPAKKSIKFKAGTELAEKVK